MAVFHGILKFVPAEICGKTPCAEVLTREIYGIGTGAYSRVKCLGTACGRKKFGDFYPGTFGDGRDMPVLSFTARFLLPCILSLPTRDFFRSRISLIFTCKRIVKIYSDYFGLLSDYCPVIIRLPSGYYQITVMSLSIYFRNPSGNITTSPHSRNRCCAWKLPIPKTAPCLRIL